MSDKRSNFTAVPNIDDDDLDPFQGRLMLHYRRVCGIENKPCDESTRVLAEKTRMSTGKVSEARAQLVGMGRIRVTYTGKGCSVTLIDVWGANRARYDRSAGEPVHTVNSEQQEGAQNGEHVQQVNERVHTVNGDREHVHTVNGKDSEDSPDQEREKEEKDSLLSLLKEDRARASPTEVQLKQWSITLIQLEMQLDRASFDTWVRGATLLAVQSGPPDVWQVGTRSPMARDNCEHRIGRLIKRVFLDCGGFKQDAVTIEYVVAEGVT